MSSIKIFQTHESLERTYLDYIYYSFAIGTDNISHSTFNRNLSNEISIIHRKLSNETFQFTRYKLNLLSKGRQKFPREIYIPTIRDRVVLKTIHLYLQDLYFNELDYKMPQVIIKEITESIESYNSYIKIDIKNFYPSIDHEKLLTLLKEKIDCEYSLKLIRKALQPQKNEKIGGVPQGLSISNILASIYLYQIDKAFQNEGNIRYFRFVDDILILCNESEIETLKTKINKEFSNLHLEIHPITKKSKSQSGNIQNNIIEYLGYSFQGDIITVRKSTINNLYSSIIQCFSKFKYSKNKNIGFLLFQLNLKITGCIDEGKAKGWIFFFSQINDLILLKKLDLFVAQNWKKFNVDPNYLKFLKKFTKAYHEIRFNFKKSNYFNNFDSYNFSQKIGLLENIFNVSTSGLSEAEINEIFKIKTKSQINKLLIDLRNFS